MNEGQKEVAAQGRQTAATVLIGFIVLIGVIVIVAIGGAVWKPELQLPIFGFAVWAINAVIQNKKGDDRDAEIAVTKQSQVRQERMQVAQSEVTDATRTLVNGTHGVTLKALAVMSRRMANQTGDAVDIKVAEDAERDLADHEEKTQIIEEGKKP